MDLARANPSVNWFGTSRLTDVTNGDITMLTTKDTAVQLLKWVFSLCVVFVAMAAPNRLEAFQGRWLLSLPIELPVLILTLILAPLSIRSTLRFTATLALALLLLFKAADIATYFAFARPFNPSADLTMLPIALETLSQTNGLWMVIGIIVGFFVVLSIIATALFAAVGAVQSGMPQRAIGVSVGLALIVAGLTPIGNTNPTSFIGDHVTRFKEGLRTADRFRAALVEDEFSNIPADRRLAGLAGLDVILVFVESYGRSALDQPDYAPVVRARLQQFERVVGAAGFSARSAWLTSPTYGGESYLAHSTIVSGVWVDNQKRYAELVKSQRRTLIGDFRDGGWRTVAVMPQITRAWSEGAFFGYHQIYDATNLGYAGQPFTYMTMADQFVLASFHAKELAKIDPQPVMAEIALISSHHPWTPIPKLVPWDHIGDGVVFNTARTTETVDEVWSTPQRVGQYYAMSIDYSLETLMSFISTFGRDDMLFIVLGDHQAASFMSRSDAREVPVHIIARDSRILAAMGTGWTEGMTPSADSTIAPMSSMRSRIIQAFAKPQITSTSQAIAP